MKFWWHYCEVSLLWHTYTWITIVSSVTVSHCRSHLSNSSGRLWHFIKLSSPGHWVSTDIVQQRVLMDQRTRLLSTNISLVGSVSQQCGVHVHSKHRWPECLMVAVFSLISLKSGRTKAHFLCFSDGCYIMTSQLCAQPSCNLASALVCTNNLLSHHLFMEPWWPRGEQVRLGSIGLGLNLAIAWFP